MPAPGFADGPEGGHVAQTVDVDPESPQTPIAMLFAQAPRREAGACLWAQIVGRTGKFRGTTCVPFRALP